MCHKVNESKTILMDDLYILGATSPRWKSRCSLQSMTRTVMEFSGCHQIRYMHLSSDLCIHLMSTLSWEEGAQIVEDLENDKIDQVSLEKCNSIN